MTETPDPLLPALQRAERQLERERRARLEAEAIAEAVARQAIHDPLTELPNRRVLFDQLELVLARCRRRGDSAAILFVDLDGLKFINDGLGHSAGDVVLRTVARRLEEIARLEDTVARFGGDEFVVLCEQLPAPHSALSIAERIVSAVAEPISLEDRQLTVTAAVGIVLARGSETADDLIRDADTAMYRAKARGRGQIEVFANVLHQEILTRVTLEGDLRRALEREELFLEYQPIVNLRDQTILGFEALVRWRHPERGLLAPAEFIPLAEEIGLIVPLGDWVIRRACLQLGDWYGFERGRLRPYMSVNVSPQHLLDPKLAETVERTLLSNGLYASDLCLELTENVLISEGGTALESMEALAGLGVRLALDDFGMGYSALGSLTRFRFDALKIDRSFVAGIGVDEERSAIVAAIAGIAGALGIAVIAEGVETPPQLNKLRHLGCAFGQGYIFSPPVGEAEAGALIRRTGAKRLLRPLRNEHLPRLALAGGPH